MRALSDRLGGAATRRLALVPETRLALSLAASVFSLIFSDGISLGILCAFSGAYLILEVRPKAVAIFILAFTLMAAVAMLSVIGLGLLIEAMRGQPPQAALFPFLRMLAIMGTVLPLALNSKLSDLSATLGRLRLPGIVRLPLMITVRFIPTFLNDLAQLREAVAIRFRGRGGIRFWLASPLLAWRVFFTPLVFRLIRSADELAMAAELKGLTASTDLGGGALVLRAADRAALSLAAIGVSLASIAGSLHA